jgi:hypothetical protein
VTLIGLYVAYVRRVPRYQERGLIVIYNVLESVVAVLAHRGDETRLTDKRTDRQTDGRTDQPTVVLISDVTPYRFFGIWFRLSTVFSRLPQARNELVSHLMM